MMQYDLWGLFLSAFVSATLFPGGSEVILAILSSQAHHPPWLLLAVATAGNTMGGMSSWLIGRLIAIRYPSDAVLNQSRQTALKRVRKWGSPILLLSWLPIAGDPLCVAAGWLKLNLFLSLTFIAIGKAARYYIIIYATA